MQTQSATVAIVRDDSKPSTIVFPGVCTAEVCIPRARHGEDPYSTKFGTII